MDNKDFPSFSVTIQKSDADIANQLCEHYKVNRPTIIRAGLRLLYERMKNKDPLELFPIEEEQYET